MLSRVLARMRGGAKRLGVYGVCPQTEAPVLTHAYMSLRELKRFNRHLVLFCPACRRAHQFSRTDLSLDPSSVAER